MSVVLTPNIEQYLISLPYPKDIADHIAEWVLKKVERLLAILAPFNSPCT